MNVWINFLTYGSYGGGFDPPLRYFSLYLSDLWADIYPAIDTLELNLGYPKKAPTEQATKWYSSLPYSRFTKKSGLFQVSVAFPELSARRSVGWYKLYPLFLDKLREVITIIDKKIGDQSEAQKALRTIDELTLLDAEKLKALDKAYEIKARQNRIDGALADRTARQNANIEPNRLIYDLRFYYRIDGIDRFYFAPFDLQLCGAILERLRAAKFKLPNYTHIYISVSDTYENALYHASRLEKWFAYSIAVLKNPAEYATKKEREKRQIVFDLIKEGLLDAAKIDNLDLATLTKVLDETEASQENENAINAVNPPRPLLNNR
ncbi:MAG: hypothetical protein LBC09_01130 [Helicobacteraceae bacterium]|jgi:hypothetical protein|nr:hypothetical protein [Helicobacteraceae bacterium]